MSYVYTIGHSTHSVERLVELLRMHMVSAVADVRSSPYSRHNPQFNREPFMHSLGEAGIEYVFLGAELGARPSDSACYVDGKVRFDRVARTGVFKRGIERLRAGLESHRVALLCAEKDPIGCHRMILVCRALRSTGVAIAHILEDGALEANEDAERRLMAERGIMENDLFATPDDLIEKAYDRQAERIAFTEKSDD